MNNQFSQQSESAAAVQSPSGEQTKTASENFGGVKESVREAGEKLKTKTKEVASQARQQGGRYIEQNKARAADRIGSIGESLRQTADRFEEEQDPNVAHYTRLVAGKLEDAAAYVREQDLSHLRRDTEDFARRHPALFYGGMFTLGLAAARFLKATRDREKVEQKEQPSTESAAMAQGV